VEGQVLLWSGATTARARCGGAGAVVGAHIRAIGADDVERGVGLQWRACSGRQNGWSGRRRDCDSGHTLMPGRQAGRQAGRSARQECTAGCSIPCPSHSPVELSTGTRVKSSAVGPVTGEVVVLASSSG
jgi:hypothetical protein